MKPKLKLMNKSRGKLIYLCNSKVTTLHFNEPFDVLQNKKKEYERMSEYKQGKLILTYC